MTARDHADPIPALVHIPLIGLRTVGDRAWLYPFRWRVHNTLVVRVYAGYITVAVSKKDFWARKLKYHSSLWYSTLDDI
jgi:hypothetical protein